jgi:hypothetical protein
VDKLRQTLGFGSEFAEDQADPAFSIGVPRYVIDREGIIRARLGEGPACASEIEDALRPPL